jgi:hypothetical protein
VWVHSFTSIQNRSEESGYSNKRSLSSLSDNPDSSLFLVTLSIDTSLDEDTITNTSVVALKKTKEE